MDFGSARKHQSSPKTAKVTRITRTIEGDQTRMIELYGFGSKSEPLKTTAGFGSSFFLSPKRCNT